LRHQPTNLNRLSRLKLPRRPPIGGSRVPAFKARLDGPCPKAREPIHHSQILLENTQIWAKWTRSRLPFGSDVAQKPIIFSTDRRPRKSLDASSGVAWAVIERSLERGA
jgi:hypothetical protein